MYCLKCGCELVDEAEFCVGCGTRTTTQASPTNKQETSLAQPKSKKANWLSTSVLVIVLLVGSAWIYVSKNNDQVEQPKFSAGETWTFISYSARTTEYVVYEARALKNGTIEFLNTGGSLDGLMSYKLPGAWKPRFPLYPTATWKDVSIHDIGDNKKMADETDVIVGGWEQVTVPAGTFRSLRINVTNTLGTSSPRNFTMWFSPQTKCIVKIMVGDRVSMELTAYSPK